MSKSLLPRISKKLRKGLSEEAQKRLELLEALRKQKKVKP